MTANCNLSVLEQDRKPWNSSISCVWMFPIGYLLGVGLTSGWMRVGEYGAVMHRSQRWTRTVLFEYSSYFAWCTKRWWWFTYITYLAFHYLLWSNQAIFEGGNTWSPSGFHQWHYYKSNYCPCLCFLLLQLCVAARLCITSIMHIGTWLCSLLLDGTCVEYTWLNRGFVETLMCFALRLHGLDRVCFHASPVCHLHWSPLPSVYTTPLIDSWLDYLSPTYSSQIRKQRSLYPQFNRLKWGWDGEPLPN